MAKIVNGRQNDPKESNALLSPILEIPTDHNKNLTRLPKVNAPSTIVKSESQPKQERVNEEEDKFSNGYGANEVYVYDANSRSSRDQSNKEVTKKGYIIYILESRHLGSKKSTWIKKKST